MAAEHKNEYISPEIWQRKCNNFLSSWKQQLSANRVIKIIHQNYLKLLQDFVTWNLWSYNCKNANNFPIFSVSNVLTSDHGILFSSPRITQTFSPYSYLSMFNKIQFIVLHFEDEVGNNWFWFVKCCSFEFWHKLHNPDASGKTTDKLNY